jgi:hypothetical protein
LVRLRILEAYIETMRAENEMLKRRLVAAEVRPARSVPRCGVGVVARLTSGCPSVGALAAVVKACSHFCT